MIQYHNACVEPIAAAVSRLCGIDSMRIRLMPHPFSYYAEGHTLVRLTSGDFRGVMGYIIRIARDRCLVTNVNGMGVAIKGIHNDTYEEVTGVPVTPPHNVLR